jgi:hypothetical protein
MILLKIKRNLIVFCAGAFIFVSGEILANAAPGAQVEFKDFELTEKSYQAWYNGLNVNLSSIDQTQANIIMNDMINEVAVNVSLFESRKVWLGSKNIEIQLLGFFNETTKETSRIVRIILNDPNKRFIGDGFFFENLKTLYECQISNTKTGNCTPFFQQTFSKLQNCYEKPFPLKMEAVISGFSMLTIWVISNQTNLPGNLEFNNFYKYDCVDFNAKLSKMNDDMFNNDGAFKEMKKDIPYYEKKKEKYHLSR